METLSTFERVDRIRNQLGYVGIHMVECNRHSGGLALLWKDSISIFILGTTTNFIDAQITGMHIGTWRFTGFYGILNRTRQRESWWLIRHLFSLSTLPWCIMGNFNDIVATTEKKGWS